MDKRSNEDDYIDNDNEGKHLKKKKREKWRQQRQSAI